MEPATLGLDPDLAGLCQAHDWPLLPLSVDLGWEKKDGLSIDAASMGTGRTLRK